MVMYNYKDINTVDLEGILFLNGFKLTFAECRDMWAYTHNIDADNTTCVAERNVSGKMADLIFYTASDIVKISFCDRILFFRRAKVRELHRLVSFLNDIGYTTYDLT